MFDAQTGPLAWEPPLDEVDAPDAVELVELQKSVAACGPGLRLVASIVDAARPARSMATVQDAERTHLLSLDSPIAHLTLSAVRPTEVDLQASDGTLCSLGLFAPGTAALKGQTEPSVAPTPVKSTPKGNAFISQEELVQHVRQLGSGDYAVSRKLVLRALTDPGKAAAGAQFRPADRDGRGAGMEIRAIRPDSLLASMGLQSGDVVRSMSGESLTTAKGLLAAIQTLRQSDSVTLEIVRGDTTQTVNYLLD